MKMTIWSATALIGLLAIVAAVLEKKETVSTNGELLHVVGIGKMSLERAAHQATLLKSGQVLITGGCAGHGCDRILTSVETYDPINRSFRSVAPMVTPRASHAAIGLPDGRVLVIGGWTGRGATARVEIYDPASNQWTFVHDMIEPRMSPIANPLADGRVLVVGGEVRTGTALASAEIFDPTTSTFSKAGSMRTPRGSHVAIPLADGRLLVTGGHRSRGEILRSAEIYDPATGEFHPAGDMAVPRHKHAAAHLGDGRVLIIGGSDSRDYRGRYTSTELYDPKTGKFSPGPELGWGRHKIRDAVTVLPSGAVLVAGGAPQLEIMNPAGQIFVPLEGKLSSPLMFATATLLPTGGVLVIGGYDERTQSSMSAWLVETTR
jgi:hypothetical protein